MKDQTAVLEIQDLETRYGPAMAQYIYDQIEKTDQMVAANESYDQAKVA